MIFFFNDTATTEIYTLSLHDALPIFVPVDPRVRARGAAGHARGLADPRRADPAGTAATPARLRGRAPGTREGSRGGRARPRDRKSTRLNSSHATISHAVFCLKKNHNR